MTKQKIQDPIKETIKTYDSIAEDYMKRYLSFDDKNVMQPALDKFLSKIEKRNPKVLDIGTGAGFDAKYLYKNGCDVISIDLSDKFLEIAKKIVPQVEFIKMDMRNLDFANNSFDGVWASASLLHLTKKDILPVLRNINAILKSNGCFFVAMKKGRGEKFVVNKGKGNLENAKRFFSFYSKVEFEELLNKSGFQTEEFKENKNRENVWMNFYCRKSI